jgi:hypothetical protein
VPELSPEEAELMRAEFNANVSDEEDNSWADELSDHALPDEYYGEEAEEYGDEASPGDASPSPEKQYEAPEEQSPKRNKKKIVINVFSTEYDVVKKVAKKVNEFKLVEMEEDHEGGVYKGQGGGKLSPYWDITWHDLAITPDFLSKL